MVTRKGLPVALLGAGGESPHLSVLEMDSFTMGRLLSGPSGNSFYTAAFNEDGNAVVTGTKSGLLYVVDLTRDIPDPLPIMAEQRCSILSACFCERSHVVSSDLGGRVFLWEIREDRLIPQILPSGGGVVCSLVSTTNELLGFTEMGTILRWDYPLPCKPTVIRSPSPPRVIGLVKGVWWPARGAIAFPAEGGQAILVDLKSSETTTFQPHEEDFYALAVLGDWLVTGGYGVGGLKFWDPDDIQVARIVKAPGRIVALAPLPTVEDMLLLVLEDGSGTLVRVEDQGVHIEQGLPSRDFRTVAGLCGSALAAQRARAREVEAERITHQLEDGKGCFNDSDRSRLLDRLTFLGYQHVALAWRAQQANAAGDLVDELRLRLSLLPLLNGRPSEEESLRLLATLQERLGLCVDAGEHWRCLSIARPESSYKDCCARCEQYAELLDSGRAVWVPGAGVSPQMILQAAALVGKSFNARLLLGTLPEMSCSGVHLTVDELLDHCETSRSLGDERGFHRMSREVIHFLQPDQTVAVEDCLVVSSGADMPPGLELILSFSPSPDDSLLVQRVVLNPVKPDQLCDGNLPGNPVPFVEDPLGSPRSRNWLQFVFTRVLVAIGNLINREIHKKHHSASNTPAHPLMPTLVPEVQTQEIPGRRGSVS